MVNRDVMEIQTSSHLTRGHRKSFNCIVRIRYHGPVQREFPLNSRDFFWFKFVFILRFVFHIHNDEPEIHAPQSCNGKLLFPL